MTISSPFKDVTTETPFSLIRIVKRYSPVVVPQTKNIECAAFLLCIIPDDDETTPKGHARNPPISDDAGVASSCYFQNATGGD